MQGDTSFLTSSRIESQAILLRSIILATSFVAFFQSQSLAKSRQISKMVTIKRKQGLALIFLLLYSESSAKKERKCRKREGCGHTHGWEIRVGCRFNKFAFVLAPNVFLRVASIVARDAIASVAYITSLVFVSLPGNIFTGQ